MEKRWAQAFLQNSPRFRKLPLFLQEECVYKAFSFANEKSEQFKGEYGGDFSLPRLSKIAKRMGCEVTLDRSGTPCPFLSDFDPNKQVITLYEKNIGRFYESVKDDFPDCFLSYGLREMCLLHELCHVMEYRDLGCVGRLFGVEGRGLFKRKIYIRRLSEVAAHRFVEILMALPASPALFGVRETAKVP